MTTEVTESTNDAPVEDNISSDDSLLSGAPVDVTENQIPAKFLNEDGTTDYEKLTKSYNELEKKIGSKIGVDDVSEYDYEWQDGSTGEDYAEDEAYQEMVQTMFELGLSKEQFQGVMGNLEEQTRNLIDQLVVSPEKAEETLSEVWGNDFEDNMKHARAAFEAFAPEGMDINNSIFNNPDVLQLLASIGSQVGEDTTSVQSSVPTGITQSEIEAIMLEPDYYTNDEKQAKVAAYFRSKN